MGFRLILVFLVCGLWGASACADDEVALADGTAQPGETIEVITIPSSTGVLKRIEELRAEREARLAEMEQRLPIQSPYQLGRGREPASQREIDEKLLHWLEASRKEELLTAEYLYGNLLQLRQKANPTLDDKETIGVLEDRLKFKRVDVLETEEHIRGMKAKIAQPPQNKAWNAGLGPRHYLFWNPCSADEFFEKLVPTVEEGARNAKPNEATEEWVTYRMHLTGLVQVGGANGVSQSATFELQPLDGSEPIRRITLRTGQSERGLFAIKVDPKMGSVWVQAGRQVGEIKPGRTDTVRLKRLTFDAAKKRAGATVAAIRDLSACMSQEREAIAASRAIVDSGSLKDMESASSNSAEVGPSNPVILGVPREEVPQK